MFLFQLHVFIIIVCEKIGRDKKGKSPWVKARKKPSHKSQGKKSCQNRQGLMVYAIFTACPRATINKFCLLGVSKSWTWWHQQLLWISSEQSSVMHNSMVVSCKSYFCWESPGTLFLCCYWQSAFQVFQIVNLTCGKQKVWSVNKTLEVKKHTLYLR